MIACDRWLRCTITTNPKVPVLCVGVLAVLPVVIAIEFMAVNHVRLNRG